jgi:hypothetical protein
MGRWGVAGERGAPWGGGASQGTGGRWGRPFWESMGPGEYRSSMGPARDQPEASHGVFGGSAAFPRATRRR